MTTFTIKSKKEQFAFALFAFVFALQEFALETIEPKKFLIKKGTSNNFMLENYFFYFL